MSKSLNLILRIKSFRFEFANNYSTKAPQKKLKKMKIGIVWFRNDLRINDNSALNHAIDLINKSSLDCIVPFYCFDKDRFDGVSREAKLPRCGPFRRNFLIESVENLKHNLITKLKSNLNLKKKVKFF